MKVERWNIITFLYMVCIRHVNPFVYSGLDIFQQSAVEAHNKYRKLHSSPPLKLNGEMAAQATEYAKTLAKSSIKDVEHSLKSSRDNQGENIYAACGTNPSGADVTKEW